MKDALMFFGIRCSVAAFVHEHLHTSGVRAEQMQRFEDELLRLTVLTFKQLSPLRSKPDSVSESVPGVREIQPYFKLLFHLVHSGRGRERV